jgi:hypothetical protein
MPGTLKDCKCIDPDDKHELSKSVLARIELYRKSIKEIEMEDTIEQIESFEVGEIELKLSPKSAKKVNQYKDIINRLESLHTRLENTPECR